MQYDAAPLEGITGYIFRNAHRKYFPGTDRYYIPFIEPKPNSRKIFNAREYNDILPEHNQGFEVVPQILTNKAEDFLWTANHLMTYGYKEININLGCPSKTVVSKKRGSGFLTELDDLNRFLDTIFSSIHADISIKTRLGRYEEDEFYKILEIYNQYPLKELIIHPRTQQDFYRGEPHLDLFETSLSLTKHKICYNGNLFTPKDVINFQKRFPSIDRLMFGRGLMTNPGLIVQIKEGKNPDVKTMQAFHDEIFAGYREVLPGDIPVLYKMKELWCFMAYMFEDQGRLTKSIKKASNLKAFEVAARQVFENSSINPENGFQTTKLR